jgi:hypothetical protein
MYGPITTLERKCILAMWSLSLSSMLTIAVLEFGGWL